MTTQTKQTVTLDMRVLKGQFMRKYLELHNAGWKTLWRGEGKICLESPAHVFEPSPDQNCKVCSYPQSDPVHSL